MSISIASTKKSKSIKAGREDEATIGMDEAVKLTHTMTIFQSKQLSNP